jgi:hypothetical protein
MNTIPSQIAKNFRELHYGGNWTGANLKDVLEGITWQQATTQVHQLNTIALLIFHINYYVSAILKFLQDEPLKAHDKYSFDLPPVASQEDWDNLLKKMWQEADALIPILENLPEDKMWETFADEKYGTYYRNLQGLVEHTHYHLGQIALLKRIVQASS